MTIALALSAFGITRFFSFFNLHESNSSLVKLVGGGGSMYYGMSLHI